MDLLSESSVFEHSHGGLAATRWGLVEDITGAGVRAFSEALRSPGVPVMLEPYPGIDTLLVTRRLAHRVPDCTTKFKVEIRYGFPEVSGGPFDNPPTDQVVPQLEIDSSVVMKKTNIAFDTEADNWLPIRITDYRAVDYNEDGTPRGLKPEPEPEQGGMVDAPVAVTVLRYSRRELPVDSRGRGIATKSMFFTGRTNSAILAGYPPKTWLCSRIGFVSDDGGASFNATYEFIYNPDTWDATVVYIDPKTGQPGDGVSFQPGGFWIGGESASPLRPTSLISR
jgi:hypothetical protein